ncbi:MAG: CotH kinase family protein [Ignavibacteriales bacterium]|nr:CotH kinase family protein [Ignavibacteriales bacterium]
MHPQSTEGERAKAPGFVLRACTVADDFSVSEPVTHTYIFADNAGLLSVEGAVPGPHWPSTSQSSQSIDYGMSSTVLNDIRYRDVISNSLRSIPTISLSTDLKHLFDADSGIYMNAMMDGRTWERPVSIELLNPDGTEGFQINCGLRIRGGWSRHGENPKHAFRLFFRSDYGYGKLKFPLFDSEGAAEFDKVDLRTAQNYAWSYPGHLGQYNTMISEVFCRDLQREMGQPYTRSRFYHLYINGVYWGIYQTQERSEANYAATYFGGAQEDYDVIKNGDNYVVEATDGSLDAYRTLWNFCSTGFSSNTMYFMIQGLAPDGTKDPLYKTLVDIDNLIDYMLVIFYSGNFDSPTSKFGNNKGLNNFYAVYNRNGNRGFQFFVHDAEHTLRTTAGEGPGIGLYENRVNIGDLTDGYRMLVNDFSVFHPQWLHFRLSSNAEYRMRFADHVYKHFFNRGCLTPARTAELFLARAAEIDTAIIGESARWGNTYLYPAATRDDTWKPAINDIVKNYLPKRSSIVLSQLQSASLYPAIQPPLFLNGADTLPGESIRVSSDYTLTLSNPNGSAGTIQYTLDNSDPRAIGGTSAPEAKHGGNRVDVTIRSTTVVKARILNGGTWSALHEIVLFSNDNVRDLKVTEIHYHPLPADTVSGNEIEFLELKNTGSLPINLSQAAFSKGITYTFPTGCVIDPNAFIVLASNKAEFTRRYAFLPFGEYDGQLDNSGERVLLMTAAADTIFSIQYDDTAPWPVAPDTGGYSLVPKEINPRGDQNDGSQWRSSYAVHGSPGRDDNVTAVEKTPAPIAPRSFALYQNYPNPFNPISIIRYQLPAAARVTLTIYDVLGREVTMLVNEIKTAGDYSVTFDASRLSSGMYWARLQGGQNIQCKKMMLIR